MAFLNESKVGFNGAWKLASIGTVMTVAAFVVRTRSPQTSCLQFADPSFISADPPVSRSLPVVVIFHVIASICVGVIRLQQRIHQRNATAAQKLWQDLMQSKKKK